MSLFQRLITETQISNPPEPAMDHDLIKLMVLLPAIAIYFRSFRYETPCSHYWVPPKSASSVQPPICLDYRPQLGPLLDAQLYHRSFIFWVLSN